MGDTHESFTILHTNIRGFSSKTESLNAIVQLKNPDILTINETKLKGNKKPEVGGYKSFTRNRKSCDGGGIATLVSNSIALHTLKSHEGEGKNEFIVTRHSNFATALNVINVYGSQESRSNKEEVLEHWIELVRVISNIEAKMEHICIIGDFNRRIGILPNTISQQPSYGGSLICSLLETGRFCLVNSSSKVIGGPYTRYDPADPANDDKQSILDLCIVSSQLMHYVDCLEIDNNCLFTPHRPLHSRLVFTDHYSLVLKLKGLPKKVISVPGKKTGLRWNTNKLNGWENYIELTTNNEKLQEIVESSENDPQIFMNQILIVWFIYAYV